MTDNAKLIAQLRAYATPPLVITAESFRLAGEAADALKAAEAEQTRLWEALVKLEDGWGPGVTRIVSDALGVKTTPFTAISSKRKLSP